VTTQGYDFKEESNKGWFGGIGSYISKSIWG